MLEEIVPVLKKFRDKIYNFFPLRRDATIELVDALSSNITATSVVELSLSPLHRRNYCSITRVLDEYTSEDPVIAKKQEQALMQIFSDLCVQFEQKRAFHLFAVDITPGPRVFSPTLKDRSYVYAPNAVVGNKPVTIGHKYSIAAYLPEKQSSNVPPWLIPLSCKRIDTTQNGELIGMQQIADCIASQHDFLDQLSVSMGDTAYNTPLCLAIAKTNVNQVHVSRGRNNRTLFYPHVPDDTVPKKRGRPKIYGDAHKLNDQSTWREPDESIKFTQLSAQGKIQIIIIDCWNEIIMRGKKDCNLSDYPLRLLRVRVYKESGDLLFNRPLWLTAAGSRRLELSLRDIFNCYRQRFDIEHFFRFGKNRLLMDKLQTPDVRHEESWWQLVMIAYAQLYLGRHMANNYPNPWEKYLPAFKTGDAIKQPTQVQKDFERIIQLIGTPAQPPKPRNKSLGRQLGDIQEKRKRYKVVKKSKSKPNEEKLAA
jgi:hypothetical protein